MMKRRRYAALGGQQLDGQLNFVRRFPAGKPLAPFGACDLNKPLDLTRPQPGAGWPPTAESGEPRRAAPNSFVDGEGNVWS